MKRFFNRTLLVLISISFLFCCFGCSDINLDKFNPLNIFNSEDNSNSDNSTSSSGVTIDFNGGVLNNQNRITFKSDEIAPYVGMDIEDALYELDFGIENLQNEGFVLYGFTKTKNGDDYVWFFPTFGTIYAKWGSDSVSDGGNVGSILVTFNLNGGSSYDNSLGYEVSDEISMPIDADDYLDLYFTSVPYKNGYTFTGWTLTLNGDDIIEKTSEIPESYIQSGTVTLYAKWSSTIELFRYGDIVGDFTVDENGNVIGEGVLLNWQGNGISTYQFTYDSSIMNGWGSQQQYGPNTVRFKLRPTRNWSVAYGSYESPIINGSYISISKIAGNGDIVVSNLQDGVTYTIEVVVSNSGECKLRIYTEGGGYEEPSVPENPGEIVEVNVLSEISNFESGSGSRNFIFYCDKGKYYTVNWYDSDNSSELINILKINGLSNFSLADIRVSIYSEDGKHSVCTSKDTERSWSFIAEYTGYYVVEVIPYNENTYGYFAIEVVTIE